MPSILIMDDDDLLVELLAFKLGQKGYSVSGVGDGEEGLAMALASPPDLIVLDGMMPGMDGFDVLRRLKEETATRDVPVIMLSARNQEKDVLGGLDLGAAEYMSKPFMPEELIVKVQRLLRSTVRS